MKTMTLVKNIFYFFFFYLLVLYTENAVMQFFNPVLMAAYT